jgi:hypothetical protein
MACRSSTRNPVQVRAVQFYSSLVEQMGAAMYGETAAGNHVRPATVTYTSPSLVSTCKADSYGAYKKRKQNWFRFRSCQNCYARPYGNTRILQVVKCTYLKFCMLDESTRQWNL